MTWCRSMTWTHVRQGTRKLVERMTAEDFYKGDLKLEKEKRKASEAFGFEFRVAGGLLRTRPVQKFGLDVEGGGMQKLVPDLQSGKQFGPDQRKMAAVAARLIRILDMSNGPSAEVEMTVWRMAEELLRAEYDRAIIVKALWRVQGSAWLDLRRVIRALEDPMEESKREELRRSYDQARWLEMEADFVEARNERRKVVEERMRRRNGGRGGGS